MKKGTTIITLDDVHRVYVRSKLYSLYIHLILNFLRLLALIIHELGLGDKGN